MPEMQMDSAVELDLFGIDIVTDEPATDDIVAALATEVEAADPQAIGSVVWTVRVRC